MFSPMTEDEEVKAGKRNFHLISPVLKFKEFSLAKKMFRRLIIFTIWLMMVAIGGEYQNDANSKIASAWIETSGNEKMLRATNMQENMSFDIFSKLYTKISKFNFMMNVNKLISRNKMMEITFIMNENSICLLTVGYHVIVDFKNQIL